MQDDAEQDAPERIALITGASRGLGAAMAQALGVVGWQVIAVARTLGGLEELDDRIRAGGGRPATLAPIDITKDDALRHLCRQTHDRWGRIDLWVHSAIHAPPLSPAGHIGAKDWDRTIAVNVRAPGVLIGMIEPLLRPSAAPVALFFDDAATQGARFYGAYGASKAAQMALVRSWQAETARLGPRVLVAEPAPMPTALRARFHPGENRDGLARCADEAARILRDLDI